MARGSFFFFSTKGGVRRLVEILLFVEPFLMGVILWFCQILMLHLGPKFFLKTNFGSKYYFRHFLGSYQFTLIFFAFIPRKFFILDIYLLFIVKSIFQSIYCKTRLLKNSEHRHQRQEYHWYCPPWLQ